MARWVRRVIIIVVLAGLAGWLAARWLSEPPVPVTVHTVQTGTVNETVTNSKSGSIRTRHRAKLSPEIGGRVEMLGIRKGDRVTKGQVLVRIANDDLRALVALRERSLEAGQAAERAACLAAEQARRTFLRNEALSRDRIVSPDALDDSRSRMDVTAAQCTEAGSRVQEARAALEATRVDFARTEIRAPFDGVVAELETEIGEWVSPSPPGVPIPPILDILDPQAIYVSAPIDEVDVGKVLVGQRVMITMDSHPGRSFDGVVTRVAPYVQDFEEENRTFEIEVEFEDRDMARTFLPGTSADVEVVLDSKSRVVRIPTYALIEGQRVLVVSGGALVSREVETGLRNWQFTEITRGLSAGDQVVVSLDRVEVKEGAEVEVEDETES